MKSSYKLFGSFWDKQTFSMRNISIRCQNITSQNIIEVSKIFSDERLKEFNFIDCEPIILMLDYFPSNTSTVVIEFFVKRVLQIANYYNVNVLVCDKQSEADLIELVYDTLEKRKASNGLLAQSHDALQMIC